MKGFMASLMAAFISAEMDVSAFGRVGGAFGARGALSWSGAFVPFRVASGSTPSGFAGAVIAFLERGVGDGSV